MGARSENRRGKWDFSGFGEPGSTPQPRIPRNTPQASTPLPGEGVFWISHDRDDRMGQKSKPQKIPGPNFNTKKSHAEYPSHKNFQKALNDITPKKETLV